MAKLVPLLRTAREVQSDTSLAATLWGQRLTGSRLSRNYAMAVQTQETHEAEGTRSFPAPSRCPRKGYRTLGGDGCRGDRGSSGFGQLNSAGFYISMCSIKL